jgi:hypothetical protein
MPLQDVITLRNKNKTFPRGGEVLGALEYRHGPYFETILGHYAAAVEGQRRDSELTMCKSNFKMDDTVVRGRGVKAKASKAKKSVMKHDQSALLDRGKRRGASKAEKSVMKHDQSALLDRGKRKAHAQESDTDSDDNGEGNGKDVKRRGGHKVTQRGTPGGKVDLSANVANKAKHTTSTSVTASRHGSGGRGGGGGGGGYHDDFDAGVDMDYTDADGNGDGNGGGGGGGGGFVDDEERPYITFPGGCGANSWSDDVVQALLPDISYTSRHGHGYDHDSYGYISGTASAEVQHQYQHQYQHQHQQQIQIQHQHQMNPPINKYPREYQQYRDTVDEYEPLPAPAPAPSRRPRETMHDRWGASFRCNIDESENLHKRYTPDSLMASAAGSWTEYELGPDGNADADCRDVFAHNLAIGPMRRGEWTLRDEAARQVQLGDTSNMLLAPLDEHELAFARSLRDRQRAAYAASPSTFTNRPDGLRSDRPDHHLAPHEFHHHHEELNVRPRQIRYI